MRLFSRPRGKGYSMACAAALAASLLIPSPLVQPSANATVDDIAATGTVFRVGGNNRFLTAVELSKRHYQPGVHTVYLASGITYPDALSAAAVAGNEKVPVLLTERDKIPAAVGKELQRLAPKRIVLIGGPGALRPQVQKQAAQLVGGAEIRRVAGDNRYQTAAALALASYRDGAQSVYIASGKDFPDALTAAAAAGSQDAPVLLATNTELPPITAEAISQLSPKRIVLVGGSGVISAQTAKSIGALLPDAKVVRHGGANRFETARLVAAAEFGIPTHAIVASGLDYPDALVGASIAAKYQSPVLLTLPRALHPATRTALTSAKPKNVTVVGWVGVIQDSVRLEIAKLLGYQLNPGFIKPPPPPKPKPPISPRTQPFVYGTLRTGQVGYNRLLAGNLDRKYLTNAPGYDMYVKPNSWFPWAVTAAASHRVIGEEMWIRDDRYWTVMANLDNYENYNPNKPVSQQAYVRVKTKLARGSTAWIYQASPHMRDYLVRYAIRIPSGDWLNRGPASLAPQLLKDQNESGLKGQSIAESLGITVNDVQVNDRCQSMVGEIAAEDGMFVTLHVEVDPSADFELANSAYLPVLAENFSLSTSSRVSEAAHVCMTNHAAPDAFVPAGGHSEGIIVLDVPAFDPTSATAHYRPYPDVGIDLPLPVANSH